jgi:ribulose-5-phosphate 4-epimerase/fuculose-1-phosphate aldolase
VDYTDPGLTLSREIRRQVDRFVARYEVTPKTIYLRNHGFIALGESAREVVAITEMADKAAQVLIGAISCGGPNFLSPANANRIANRPDEHLRQKALGLKAC